jgi:hypothetical protein
MFIVPEPWVRVLVVALELLNATAVRLKPLRLKVPAESIAVPELVAVSSIVVLLAKVNDPLGQLTLNCERAKVTPAVLRVLANPCPTN